MEYDDLDDLIGDSGDLDSVARPEKSTKAKEVERPSSSAGFPSVREELERKLYETIESLVNRRTERYISSPAFVSGVDCLLSTVSGLISDKAMLVLSELETMAANDRHNVPESIRRHFIASAGVTVALTWKIGYASFQFEKWVNGEEAGAKSITHPSAKSAFDAMVRMADGLIERGFKAI